MTNCLNCQSPITCGCQVRVASDGKKVCSNCITAYEQQLNVQRATVTQVTVNINPTQNETFTS